MVLTAREKELNCSLTAASFTSQEHTHTHTQRDTTQCANVRFFEQKNRATLLQVALNNSEKK